ncbi:MAG: hypothetical protein ACYDEQ_11675 [Desulfocucumaceae bacterium]
MSHPLEKELLALSLEEAVSILEEAGLAVEIRHTAPTGGPSSTMGKGRVVRLQISQNTGIITVACEIARLSPDRIKPSSPGPAY